MNKHKKLLKNDPQIIFSEICLLLYLVAYPFFLKNKYFSMTIGKTFFFYGVTALFAIGTVIMTNKEKTGIKPLRENKTYLWGCLFMIGALISCLCSYSPIDAFSGANGRFMGLGTYIFIAVAFVCISRFGQPTKRVAVIFGISIAVMCIISYLQFLGYDPFYLYKPAKETVHINFMSLLGNKDVFYSYLSLATPFAAYLSFEAKNKKEKLFWYIISFSGFLSVFICNSDGAFVAMLAAAIFLFFAKCRDKNGLITFMHIGMLFFAAAMLAVFTKPLIPGLIIPESFVMQLIGQHIFIAPSLFAAAAIVCIVFAKCPLSNKFFKILRIMFLCILCAAASAFVAATVYFTFFNTTKDLKFMTQILRINNMWGNMRAYVWSRLLMIFHNFPMHQKLIGYGEETVEYLMNTYYKAEMLEVTKLNFDNAHNEFLQYLITQGLFGLATYILFTFSALKNAAKNGGPIQKAALAACVCYLAQSFVNISQPITTPLFFVFLAISQASVSKTPISPKI